MEKCKDRTLTPSRTRLESIDHYAGIGVLVIIGCFISVFLWKIYANWPI